MSKARLICSSSLDVIVWCFGRYLAWKGAIKKQHLRGLLSCQRKSGRKLYWERWPLLQSLFLWVWQNEEGTDNSENRTKYKKWYQRMTLILKCGSLQKFLWKWTWIWMWQVTEEHQICVKTDNTYHVRTTNLIITHWFSLSIIMFLYMLSVRA